MTELKLPPYAEISGGLPAAAVREKLISVTLAACDTYNSRGGDIDPDSFTYENIYTLPIYSVFGNDVSTDAVISLILAVLVDILSLLFAMIFVKQKSILAARTTSQAISMRDDLFEQSIAAALQLGICAKGGSFSGQWNEAEVERLAGFMCCFKAADFASDQGYTLIAPRSALGNYEALTAFLCQFGLAKTLSAAELNILTGEDEAEPCVLLKTKFLLWVGEKSSLTERLSAKEHKEAVTV